MKRLVLFVGAAFLFNAPVALADTISIPEFDTKVYCKKMAGMAGGSAMIEETCREAEAMSKAKSARYPANPRLENICRSTQKPQPCGNMTGTTRAAILSRRDIKGCACGNRVKPVLLATIKGYEVFCYIIGMLQFFKHSP